MRHPLGVPFPFRGPSACVMALFLGLPLAVPAAAQQSRYTLQGQVVDATTELPLPGVNVRFVDRALGTATDGNGRYTFTAPVEPGTYTLVYSFIGFLPVERPVTLADEEAIELPVVEMQEDVVRAEEIVVTGTAAPTARKQLGNAVSTVDARDIEQAASPAIDRALQGKIAGAYVQQNSGNPAGGISIRLRGTGTVLGTADPLYIVDGVIVNNDSPVLLDLGGGAQNRLVDLDPNDIERIEVIKGAAAAAIYGSRANNGVVQIFTKRGQQGVPRVTFTTRVQTDAVRKTLAVNEALVDNAGAAVERFDFQDEIFQRAYGTEQYLSVSGGSEGTRYYASGSHFGNEGVVRGNLFRRLNGRVRLNQLLSDWATVTVGAAFTRSQSQDVPNGGLTSNYGALTGFIFGPNTFDPRPNELGEYPNAGILANPIEVIDRYDFEQTTGRFIGDVQLGLTPLPGLGVDYTLGLDTYDQVATGFIPRGTSAPGLGTGFARRAERTSLQLNQDLRARYETPLGAAIRSTTALGGSIEYSDTESFGAQAQNLGPVTEVVQSGTVSRDFSEFRSELVLYGVFAQETLAFGDRLFLTGALRFDASSAFGEDERWQSYYKASASYNVSDEGFWQADSFLARYLPAVKLRASLGSAGGLTAIDPFQRETSYFAQPYAGIPGLLPESELGTPDIRPERQTELEAGADLGLLNNRLALELTYYDQQTTDLLLSRQLAPTTGFSSQLLNVGELQNSGFELLARALVVDARPLRWTSTLTYARNRNRVTGIEEEENPDGVLILGGFGLVAAIEDQPLGVFYGSAYARDASGNVLGTGGTPLVRDDDGFLRCAPGAPDACTGIPQRAFVDANGNNIRDDGEGLAGPKIIGDPNPDFTASWINEFDLLRGLTVRAQLDAVVGQDVFNFTRRLAALSVFGTLEDFERELEGDLPAGYNAATFGLFENWVEDGSFVKLRELSVAYTFYPASARLSSVRLSLVGRNLFSFDGYSGYDPEVNVAGQRTNIRNFDFVEVPIPRTLSLGVTVNF